MTRLQTLLGIAAVVLLSLILSVSWMTYGILSRKEAVERQAKVKQDLDEAVKQKFKRDFEADLERIQRERQE